MNLNLLLVIMAVVLICMVMDGYKKGMVKSLISLISLLITCVVLFLIGNGLSSYFDGKIFNVIKFKTMTDERDSSGNLCMRQSWQCFQHVRWCA